MVWWQENESRFPALARVARRTWSAVHAVNGALAPPGDSILYYYLSSSTDVFTVERNRLTADTAEMIVFVKHNLREIDYTEQYNLVPVNGR